MKPAEVFCPIAADDLGPMLPRLLIMIMLSICTPPVRG
jgi:hypothetical protein